MDSFREAIALNPGWEWREDEGFMCHIFGAAERRFEASSEEDRKKRKR